MFKLFFKESISSKIFALTFEGATTLCAYSRFVIRDS